MPDFKGHQKFNAVVLSVVTVFVLTGVILGKISPSEQYILFYASFILSSYCCTPDLDTDSKPLRNLYLLKYPVQFFQRFTKHRGILHNWLFSPFILTMPITILLIVFYVNSGHLLNISGTYAGIIAQIELHILLDRVVSWKK